MKKNIISFFLLFGFLFTSLLAQNKYVKNIKFKRMGRNYIISYDLVDQNEDEYNVELYFLKKNDKKFIYKPRLILGDVGKDIKTGMNKKIIWQFKDELKGKLKGKGFYFNVVAKKIEKSSGLWYYIGGGIIAAAGAAAYFIIKPPVEENKSEIAGPPGRPTK